MHVDVHVKSEQFLAEQRMFIYIRVSGRFRSQVSVHLIAWFSVMT